MTAIAFGSLEANRKLIEDSYLQVRYLSQLGDEKGIRQAYITRAIAAHRVASMTAPPGKYVALDRWDTPSFREAHP